MPKPAPEIVALSAHIMQQEARLRLQADLIGALTGLMAAAAGPQRAQVLDIVQTAGLRSSDREEGDGKDAVNARAARDMRADLAEIMKLAKATAGG